jgi:hypothetical protein
LNWTIPALVNNKVGSFAGARLLLATTSWPFALKIIKPKLANLIRR